MRLTRTGYGIKALLVLFCFGVQNTLLDAKGKCVIYALVLFNLDLFNLITELIVLNIFLSSCADLREFIYCRIKLIQLIETQREFSDLSLNGVRPIKFIAITEPHAFHTTFLHVYRFYYSSDEMVSLPSL